MKVLLIDIDRERSKRKTIPNLALMQISAYHKAKGDIVGFDVVDNPNFIYVSCVFKKFRSAALSAGGTFLNATRFVGGSGVNYNWLHKEMQKVMPDYSLYPELNHSLGFTTRGCIRMCPWCIVPQKEGRFQLWQHPREFHDPNFDTIKLLDNNWLADRKWFMQTSQWIRDRKLKLIENGLDIRLLDFGIAKRLREMKLGGLLHFAFDTMKDENAIRIGIDILKEVGFDLRSEIQFYVLVNFNTNFAEDLYRVELLKKLGTNPFIMEYTSTKRSRRLARYCNRKWIFWSCDFKDYTRNPKKY